MFSLYSDLGQRTKCRDTYLRIRSSLISVKFIHKAVECSMYDKTDKHKKHDVAINDD